MNQLDTAFSDLDVRETTHVAALDLGSNSFHLVVARINAGSVQILHKVKQKVRLAEGLADDGTLSQEAIDRGIQTLELFADSLRGFNPDSVRIVATHTLRQARNANTFIKAARKVLPYPVEVIAGIEEARLIYQGVAHNSENSAQKLVLDIGGGSTEFVIGEGFTPLLMRSLQMGCVNYTQRFFADTSLKPKAFAKARIAAGQQLEMIERRYRKLGWEQCIGTSGTIKTIVAIAQEIDPDSKPGTVNLQHIEQMIEQCCEAGDYQQLPFKNLSEERAPVFAAGLAILAASFNSLDIAQMTFSSSALREGVIYEMEDRLEHDDIRERTADSLATRYDVDIDHAKRVLQTTLDIYRQVASDWEIQHTELQQLLGWAALLHEVGLQINSRRVQYHSAYILHNAELPGFNQQQQELLATLVRFHRKKIRLDDLPEFTECNPEQVLSLICILRLGVLLNLRRQDDILPPINVKAHHTTLKLKFAGDGLQTSPLVSADLELEAEHMRGCGIRLVVR